MITEVFRQTATQGERVGEMGTASGTVGVLNFGKRERNFEEYLQSLGEEIEGFLIALLIPVPIIFSQKL